MVRIVRWWEGIEVVRIVGVVRVGGGEGSEVVGGGRVLRW